MVVRRRATDDSGIEVQRVRGKDDTHCGACTFDGGRLPITLPLDFNRARFVEIYRLGLEVIWSDAFSIRGLRVNESE